MAWRALSTGLGQHASIDNGAMTMRATIKQELDFRSGGRLTVQLCQRVPNNAVMLSCAALAKHYEDGDA